MLINDAKRKLYVFGWRRYYTLLRESVLLYFACTIILILLGLTITLGGVGDIGNSLVAAGISGIVMYWVTYIQKRRSVEDEQLLKKFKDFGIVDIYPRRLVKRELDALFPKRAKKHWDALGFSLAMFYGDMQDGTLEKVAKKVKVRLLVVHPESPYCKQRDYEEDFLEGTTKNEVIRLTKFIRNLNNPNIEIRWYKSIPTTSITMIDDKETVVGPYLVGWEHRNTYSTRLKKGVLFDYYRDHFNKIWNDPKLSCEPEYDRFGIR